MSESGWAYSRTDRAKRNKPWRRRWRHFRRRLGQPFSHYVLPPFVRLLSKTWRKSAVNGERREDVLCSPDGCIAILWHGRMLTAVPQFDDVNAQVLVSMSGDGEVADKLLKRFGYDTLRGSTSKFGVKALKTMLGTLRKKTAVAITPDGPRGPRHMMSRGPAFLGRETGLAILPIGFGVNRAWYMRSWDRFTIPKFFARVCVAYADPVRVPPDATDEDIVRIGEELRKALISAEREAFAAVGGEPDW